MEAQPSPSAAMRRCFQGRLLGGCALHYNGRPIPEGAFRRRRALFLLLQLLLAPGHRLVRDQVLDLLWPDAALQAAAAGLRAVLTDLRVGCTGEGDDPSPVLRKSGLILLDPALDLHLDVPAFEQAGAAALQDSAPEAMKMALALYGGPLLPDLPYEDWTIRPRRRLADLYHRLLVALAAHETAANPLAAEPYLRRLLELDPTDEEHARDLMRLLDTLGRRAEIRHVYEDLAAALRTELDVDPSAETTALLVTPRASHDALAVPARAARLPVPTTSFVGRGRELTTLTDLLRSPSGHPRLLTLTGVGGGGKTRLALAVAAAVREHYPGGVWLVELAAVRDPRFVSRAMAAALEVREEPNQPLTASLAAALGDRPTLLVLDNCEHLVEVCADLAAALLAACPSLRILATSRERLNTGGELAWRVPSLVLPPPTDRTADESSLYPDLADAEAVRLFVDRAELAQPGFALTERNAPLVAQICRRLDGIPLALELAAARLSVLPLDGIAARIDDRFRLLTGGSRTVLPRHQTLRAALDGSYALLTEEERVLLRRLAIFTGGWTLEAAEGICGVPADPSITPDTLWEVIGGLVHKSLVILEESKVSGRQRYRMLETVREYARGYLLACGEAPALLARYQDWYLGVAEDAAPHLIGVERENRLHVLEDDTDNLRAALSRAVAQPNALIVPFATLDPDRALRLVTALWRFWDIRGYWSEGRRWIAMALALPGAASPELRAAAMNAAAALASNQGDFREAEALWEQALVMKRKNGDPRNIAAGLNNLSIAVQHLGDYARSAALLEESLTIKRTIDDRQGIPHSLNNLGITVQHLGDLERAVTLYEEAAARWQDLGDDLNSAYARLNLAEALTRLGQPARAAALYEECLVVFHRLDESWGIAGALNNLGNMATVDGDFARAADLFRRSLRLWQYLADKQGLVENLDSWAALAHTLGQHACAVRLYAAACSFRELSGAPARPAAHALHAEHQAVARAALDPETYAEAARTGQSLTLDQALAHALEVVDIG